MRKSSTSQHCCQPQRAESCDYYLGCHESTSRDKRDCETGDWRTGIDRAVAFAGGRPSVDKTSVSCTREIDALRPQETAQTEEDTMHQPSFLRLLTTPSFFSTAVTHTLALPPQRKRDAASCTRAIGAARATTVVVTVV